MAKVSANYEVVYIIDPAQGEENTAALVAKFKTLAEFRCGSGRVGQPQAGLSHQLQDRGLLRPDDLHQRAFFPEGAGPCSADHGRHHAFPDRLQGRVRGH